MTALLPRDLVVDMVASVRRLCGDPAARCLLCTDCAGADAAGFEFRPAALP
jgi:hypothetical protein